MFKIKKAPFAKRFAAGMLDLIITAILTVGLVFLFNSVLGYNTRYNRYLDDINSFQEKYNINFDITAEEYELLSDAEKENLEIAYQNLNNEVDAIDNFSKLVKTIILSVTFALLISYALTDFVIPKIFGDGKTLGKKLVGLCLCSINQVKVTDYQVFSRAFLGKFAIETMIPAYILVMFFFRKVGAVGLVLLALVGIIQIYFFLFSGEARFLHDVFSHTVVVDYATQKIFDSIESLEAAKAEYQAQLEEDQEDEDN